MSGRTPARRRRGEFPQPAWCRRDLCDEATRGREIDHHSGPWWQLVPAHWRERRLNLAATRTDSRDRVRDPVDTGPTMVELSIDEFAPVSDRQDDPRRMWTRQHAGAFEMTTGETRVLAHQLLALADTVDAASAMPALLRVD